MPNTEKDNLEIPEYDLKDGLNALIGKIKESLVNLDRPLIIEIAGGSASGKTHAVAAKIKEEFGADATIISIDDYYRGRTYMAAQASAGRILNYDQPETLDLELLKDDLEKLKTGITIRKPIYDFKIGEPSHIIEEVRPDKVIIVEGLFALNEIIKDEGDIKVFVEIGIHGRVLRRLLRDFERTEEDPLAILKYFSEVVEPMHEKYVTPSKKNADLIIINEYDPEIEAKQFGLYEVELKFKKKLTAEDLKDLGAEKIATSYQVDDYYEPKDSSLASSGESLRIRDEAGIKILTYKGPKLETDTRRQPKLEFRIDEATAKQFPLIYGHKFKTIRKTRTVYQMNGQIFSVDNVEKEENGKIELLGDFIEITAQGGQDEVENDRFSQVLARLGIDPVAGLKEGYWEM